MSVRNEWGGAIMVQRGDGFPEEVDGDGDVKEPYDLDHVNTLGADVSDIAGRTPCDCDPQNIKDLEHEIAHAIRRDEGASDWFQDHDYRSWLLRVYYEAKRCSDCIAEELLIQFETILDRHGIIPE